MVKIIELVLHQLPSSVVRYFTLVIKFCCLIPAMINEMLKLSEVDL